MPNSYEAPPEMVTLREAEKRLNASGIPITYQTLRSLCLKNKLKHVRLARNYYLNWSALMDSFRTGGAIE